MKNATCYLHGLDLRPTLCHDCARAASAPVEATPPTRILRLTDTTFQAMERTIDSQGRINFRLRRPIERPVSSDPWAYA